MTILVEQLDKSFFDYIILQRLDLQVNEPGLAVVLVLQALVPTLGGFLARICSPLEATQNENFDGFD